MKVFLTMLCGLVTVCHGKHVEGHVDDCDTCTDDFEGFGIPASKCGCCPWPCCCKCFEISSGPGEPCRSLIDLTFILDSSGSISEEDWNGALKPFVLDLVSIFNKIGTDQLVAMVTYSNNATLNWNFGDPETSSAAALRKAITDLPLLGKLRNTVEGMEVAAEQVIGGKDDRPMAPNVVILITHGKANFRLAELPAMAARLQSEALVLVVGVTDKVDLAELETIASRPNLVFKLTDFTAIQSILTPVPGVVCPEPKAKEKCFCCCTPEQFFGGGGAYYYSRH